MDSALELVVTPVTHDLGAFKVNRTLPARQRTMVGPFIFVDEFGPARLPAGQGMDVRPHPHINLATVTYLFEGAIEHRDSIGSHQVIEPGAINLMTAGSGIVHSERSPQALRPDGPSLYGMQTWLALPDGREELAPAFDHVAVDGLPIIDDGAARARVLMGTLWGASAATPQHSPTIYADVALDATRRLAVPAAHEQRGIHVVQGSVDVGGGQLAAGEMAILETGAEAVVTAREPARLLLFGGARLDAPRHVWWNFVSSREERIAQAASDWEAGRFPGVPGETEFIPLPERGRPRPVSYP